MTKNLSRNFESPLKQNLMRKKKRTKKVCILGEEKVLPARWVAWERRDRRVHPESRPV